MSAYIPATLRQQIMTLDKMRCAYCQSPEALMGGTFEIEHIRPLSLGGETILDNLCLSGTTCNRHKSNRTGVYDAVTGIEIVFFHPRQNIWHEHFAWTDFSVLNVYPNNPEFLLYEVLERAIRIGT